MTLPPPSEAQTEAAMSALFKRCGWYPVKTEAGMVAKATRGRKRKGTLPAGFPDMIFLKGVRGTRLCLAALVETKSPTGKLSPEQIKRHAELAMYGIRVTVVRDLREAQELIAEARLLLGALKAHKVPQVDP